MKIRTGTESGKEEKKVYFMNSLTCSNKCELLRQFLKTKKKKIKGIISECVFNRLLRKDSKNSFTMRQTKPLTFHLSRFSAYFSTEIESKGHKPPELGCKMGFSQCRRCLLDWEGGVATSRGRCTAAPERPEECHGLLRSICAYCVPGDQRLWSYPG